MCPTCRVRTAPAAHPTTRAVNDPAVGISSTMPAHIQSCWKICVRSRWWNSALLYADAGRVFACLIPGGSGICRSATAPTLRSLEQELALPHVHDQLASRNVVPLRLGVITCEELVSPNCPQQRNDACRVAGVVDDPSNRRRPSRERSAHVVGMDRQHHRRPRPRGTVAVVEPACTRPPRHRPSPMRPPATTLLHPGRRWWRRSSTRCARLDR